MREDQTEPTFEFQEWFDGGDIFCRPKDKKRLLSAVEAIVENDLGVAVIGSNEAILDHYYRMLVSRIRDHEHFKLEMFLPVTTDSLLTRFNEMLAEISMEQAAAPPADDQLVRLLVINDARTINEEQWSLLARLLSDFPGVNVRLILVINKSGWPAHENLLNTLGRRMHRWVVEAPAITEARELLDAAAENGYQTETEALLIDAGLGAVVSSRQDSREEEDDPDLPQLPELDVDVLIGATADDEFLDDANTPAGRGWLWPTLMFVSISAALSLLMVSWLYPGYLTTDSSLQADPQGLSSETKVESTGYRIEAITLPTAEDLEAKRRQVQRQEAEGLAAPIDVAEESDLTSEQAAPITAEVAAEKTAVIKDNQGSEAAAEVLPLTATSDVADVDQVAEPEAPAESLAPPSQPPAIAPDSAVELVSAAPSSNYFVQHIVLSSEAAASAYIRRYTALNEARVVPVRVAQKSAWAVISGPFSSRPAAASFTQNPGVPDDYWIRNAAQLQAILRR